MSYQLSETASAAGVRPGTLKQWLGRNTLTMDGEKDKDGGGAGRVRLFSFETVMRAAIGAELIRRGVAVKNAMDAAYQFSHIGLGREPARPFPSGGTYLILADNRCSVFNATTPAEFYSEVCMAGGMPVSFVLVDCAIVYGSAVASLGGDPRGDYRDHG